jgi:hypothetical protein
MAEPPKMYCGDDEDLPEGKFFGTSSQCMRRGVGVGLYHVAPKKYGISAENIEKEKVRQLENRATRYAGLGKQDIYCGDKEELPTGQVKGSRYQCMKRGVGVGMYMLAPERYNVNYLKPYQLTVQDIYMFARKLNVPLRGPDGKGELISVEDAKRGMIQSLGSPELFAL